MRTWVKWTIGGVVVVLACFAVLAGLGGYYFARHLDTGTAAEADTLKEFDAIRARFAGKTPLIEINDLRAADVRVNRTVDPNGRRAATLHIHTWSAEDNGERLKTDVPLWLMRFSSVNILSSLGLAPERFRLTVA